MGKRKRKQQQEREDAADQFGMIFDMGEEIFSASRDTCYIFTLNDGVSLRVKIVAVVCPSLQCGKCDGEGIGFASGVCRCGKVFSRMFCAKVLMPFLTPDMMPGIVCAECGGDDLPLNATQQADGARWN